MKRQSSLVLDALRDITLNVKTDATRSMADAGAQRFTRIPAPNRWSAAMCLEHLNRYGDFYLPHLNKAVQHPAEHHPDDYRPGWLGKRFAESMRLDESGKTKRAMRSPASTNPTDGSLRPDVLLEFLDQQERYLRVIELARTVDLGQRNIPLSVAPWIKLKLGDMLHVLVYHNQRHAAQGIRALKGL